MTKEEIMADVARAVDKKRPLGLYCVFYDGETRPVAGFVLEQDARRYAELHGSGEVPAEVRHIHLASYCPHCNCPCEVCAECGAVAG